MPQIVDGDLQLVTAVVFHHCRQADELDVDVFERWDLDVRP